MLLDCYGTLVAEDQKPFADVCERIVAAAPDGVTREQVTGHWDREFDTLCEESFGEDFRLQRDIERISLARTLDRFEIDLDPAELSEPIYEHWRRPEAYDRARRFVERCPVPVCLVSNIDNAELHDALAHTGLSFDLTVTSEDCRAYKPRPEMFERALSLLDVPAAEVLHVGDSWRSDVRGANALGVPVMWINRGRKAAPEADIRPDIMSYDLSGLLAMFNDCRPSTDASDAVTLIAPTSELENEYLRFIAEFRASGEQRLNGMGGWRDDGFDAFLDRVRRHAAGVDIPTDRAPASTYWLVRDKRRVIGSVNIRHWLPPHMEHEGGHVGYSIRPSERCRGYATALLAMAVDKAWLMDVDRVLVTCDKDNSPSARVIQKNGGVLEDEVISEHTGGVVQRYRIDMAR